ncbi:MAG: UDP-2,4-diacetamido-2,4,6-trideoxy-beta-L-altropyranose hydrolase [Lachnospiraceae bacterium]|nr:UDP-2,4-diacetamido-2,4,6-trideoxy-beta-L-altropyranose hydrolase [Lachnospiraceae bacterium]
MKLIRIRTDGNRTIASGHMRRCMSIAGELKRLGATVEFVVKDGESAALLAQLAGADGASYSCRCLNSEEEEIAQMVRLAEETPTALFLMDSYAFDADYYARLHYMLGKTSPETKTACIDDLAAFDPAVDLLIHYGPAPDSSLYSAPVKLLGPAYAPLRPQFALRPLPLRPTARRLLVSTGGTDPFMILRDILLELYNDQVSRSISDLHCEAVLGAMYAPEYKEELLRITRDNPLVTLHENVSDMAVLMQGCDLAVSAGGTTLYELCAAGVPTVTYTMADNQCPFAKELHKAGAVWYELDLRNEEQAAKKLLTRVSEFVHDQALRRRMSNSARILVDGKGAVRIAEALLECIA